MKKRRLISLICLLVSLFVSAQAKASSGITYGDFSFHFEEALLGFGISAEDIAFCDLYNSEDGLEVYTCNVKTGTLITTTFLYTGSLEKVEWILTHEDADNMMKETIAVISSFYAGNALNARLEDANVFMNNLAAAIIASTGTIAVLDIGDYILTLDFGLEDINYTITLRE